MTATTTTRPPAGIATGLAGPEGFARLLRSEWTKFRTVRGYVIGMIVAALLTAFVGVFAGANASIGCSLNGGPQKTGRACLPYIPIGPGGEAVSDELYFVRQPLAGHGSITAAMTSFTGKFASASGPVQAGGPASNMRPGLVHWAKGGIIIKASTKQGSAYAAMMVTGGHGVRMQYDYTADIAGLPGAPSAAAPRWLRLVRSGDVITGYDSADGTHWTQVGVATLPGLPRVVQIGLFATSPQYVHASKFFGGARLQVGPSTATAVFEHVRLSGGVSPGKTWTGTKIGGRAAQGPPGLGGFGRSAGRLTVTGSGDIAPLVPGPGSGYPTATIEQGLAGVFAGLIAIMVVAVMFFTAEYRRGLIRVTLAASPRRWQVLAAKAVVVGVAGFAAGLVGATASILLSVPKLDKEGLFVLPVSALTEARVIVGTAAMIGLAAVFAVALGAVLRRSAVTITLAIVAVVLPFLLSVTGAFPSGAADWLLRVTPAAGNAVEQSIPQYFQVNHVYSPVGGYYPLSPAAGIAVLCAWVAAALVLAVVVLRRRDA